MNKFKKMTLGSFFVSSLQLNSENILQTVLFSFQPRNFAHVEKCDRRDRLTSGLASQNNLAA